MKYILKELLDIPRLQTLLESLDDLHSVPSAIIDRDGNILAATGWQSICTQFHRVNSRTKAICIESDTRIQDKLNRKKPFVVYKCPMGLVDAASPIIIEGEHLGNVFTGQFFLEPPDEQQFIGQAQRYGFNQTAYLEAMRQVPCYDEDHLRRILAFIHGLAQMLTEQGLQHKLLEESAFRLKQMAEHSRTFIWEVDTEGLYTYVSSASEMVIGYCPEELVGRMHYYDLHPEINRDAFKREATDVF